MGALTLPLLVTFAFGYLLGAIPFGLLLTRAAGLGDVRNVGSGNIGATNVLRAGGKALAAATLVLDALKGTAAVIVGGYIGSRTAGSLPSDIIVYAAGGGLAAFLGHLYPVWLGFKGGKGVSTYIGVLLGLLPHAAIAFCLIWLAVAFLTKYSSLSALVASVLTPVVVWLLGAPHVAVLMIPLTLLLLYKHAANITRLLKGEEPKIGAKS